MPAKYYTYYSTLLLQVLGSGSTPLAELNLSRNGFSGRGLVSIAGGLALAGSAVRVVRLNAQSLSISTEAELAMAAAAAANTAIVTISLDWRQKTHKDAAERSMMTNMDLLRKARKAAAE